MHGPWVFDFGAPKFEKRPLPIHAGHLPLPSLSLQPLPLTLMTSSAQPFQLSLVMGAGDPQPLSMPGAVQRLALSLSLPLPPCVVAYVGGAWPQVWREGEGGEWGREAGGERRRGEREARSNGLLTSSHVSLLFTADGGERHAVSAPGRPGRRIAQD